MTTLNDDCPNCGRSGMDVFYEVKDIPGHSCLMMDDKQAAVDYPRHDLSLAFCNSCGFISNAAFDTSVPEYSTRYEEQQSFSPRFRSFQTKLCEGLIERYDVRDKDVVEIGCGKGDFLVELCRLGQNRGVGIDPASIPGRVEGGAESRVRFIQDLYSSAYSDLPCDFLCCRHTLEHIHPTNEFVGLMREVVGDRDDMIVFFEVPDVERVLRESAFWDIYYEHCSYFSLGSLARVFRANRFDIAELCLDFDDQYLIIVARATGDVTEATLPQEDDLDRLAGWVEEFRHAAGRIIDDWRSRIATFNSQGRRVAVWGSGSKCVSFLSSVGTEVEIDAVVDINPFRHGKWLAGVGRQVVAPETLRSVPPDVVLVMNPIYCDEIQRQLQDMGVTAELVPV